MRRTLTSLLAVLMVLTVGAGTVTATGRSGTNLSACTNEAKDYYGGIKAFAKDKGRGGNRVLCPRTREFVQCDDCDTPLTEGLGYRLDNNLNKRKVRRRRLEDIWNRFDKNIESFKLRAAAGCVTAVTLYAGPRFLRLPGVSAVVTTPADIATSARLDNTDGTDHKTRLYEIPHRKDNKVTRIEVFLSCTTDLPPGPDSD